MRPGTWCRASRPVRSSAIRRTPTTRSRVAPSAVSGRTGSTSCSSAARPRLADRAERRRAAARRGRPASPRSETSPESDDAAVGAVPHPPAHAPAECGGGGPHRDRRGVGGVGTRRAVDADAEPLPAAASRAAMATSSSEGGHIDWHALRAGGRPPARRERAGHAVRGRHEGDRPRELDLRGGDRRRLARPVEHPRGMGRRPTSRRAGQDVPLPRVRPRCGGQVPSLAFELNQVAGTWVNDQNVGVPCRTSGDILVSYEIEGNVPAVSLSR